MPQFVIYVRAAPGAWESLSTEDQQRLIDEYQAWGDDLKARGMWERGMAIDEQIAHWLPAGAADDVAATRAETDGLVLTALFIVSVENFQAATHAAETCPARKHGEHVFVQPIA